MNENKTETKNKKLKIVLIVLVCVLAAAVLAGAFFFDYLRGSMHYLGLGDTQPTLSQEEIDAEQFGSGTVDPDAAVIDGTDIDWGQVYHKIGGDDNIVNILLVGQDRRPGETRTRSDSIILVTFNRVKETITMTSFMRDMYVDFPGDYYDNRLNVAYYFEGLEFLNETLELNFGVVVDANVVVDFDQFRDIINLLGGVQLELTESEARYINTKVGRECVTEGLNTLTGGMALWHARNRTSGGTFDFGRTSRQRDVLTALIEAYKDKSALEMVALLDDILGMISTDLTEAEVTNYFWALFPMLSKCEIITQGIPVEGGYYLATVRGMSVLVPDMEMNRQALVDSLTNNPSLTNGDLIE